MPFTPAHPAIILPFIRSRYFSATGLIAGSLSPDFEYFLKMSVSSQFSHTLTGMIYFDLPITLFIALLFHLTVKRNLIHNLPVFIQMRLHEVVSFDFLKYLRGNIVVFALSALVGAGSHILWDSFTHNNTFIVRTLSVYKTVHVPFQGVNYPLFYALQHISTVAGLLVVGIYLVSIAPTDNVRARKIKVSYWILVFLLTASVIVIRFGLVSGDFEFGNIVVTCISGFLIALICCGFINFKDTTTQP